jgi:hypothetical protein
MKKSYIFIIVLLILSVIWIVLWIYNKPHRDPQSEESIKISATELFRSYETDEAAANALYLDKALEVSGKISEVTTNQELIPIVVLEAGNPMFGVRCTMEGPTVHAKPGDTVTIKGICTGYLSDVVIIKSTVVE